MSVNRLSFCNPLLCQACMPCKLVHLAEARMLDCMEPARHKQAYVPFLRAFDVGI